MTKEITYATISVTDFKLHLTSSWDMEDWLMIRSMSKNSDPYLPVDCVEFGAYDKVQMS